MMVYTWKTTKTEAGFQWAVVTVEHNAPQTVVKSGTCTTRAKAMARAKKWLMFVKRGGVVA